MTTLLLTFSMTFRMCTASLSDEQYANYRESIRVHATNGFTAAQASFEQGEKLQQQKVDMFDQRSWEIFKDRMKEERRDIIRMNALRKQKEAEENSMMDDGTLVENMKIEEIDSDGNIVNECRPMNID